MIKFFKEKLKSRKNLLLLKKYTKPSKEFSNESRSLFISELKKRGVIAPATAHFWSVPAPFKRALSYSFASLILLSSLTGGAVVYAEKQDVAFNHPLYPMKRLGENIQVKLAPADKKPTIQDEIARKRLTEIKQLVVEKEEKINLINSRKAEEVEQAVEKIDQEINRVTTENPEEIKQAEEQKKKIVEQIEEKRKKEIEKMENENKSKTEKLDHDFRKTVSSVLKAIEPSRKESKAREKTKDLCESLRKKIREHDGVAGKNGDWPAFKDKCGEVEEND